MKTLFTIITLLLISNTQASDKEINSSIAKDFVKDYISAVKKDDFASLLKMSISKTIYHYAAVKRGLKTLDNNKYELVISPLSNKDTKVNFFKALTGGDCKTGGRPTHKAYIKWENNREEFYKGHTCHRYVGSSRFIKLVLSKQSGIIQEHTSCKKDSFPKLPTPVDISKITEYQKNIIKKNLKAQKHFSVLKAYEFINSKYGYNLRDSKKIIKAVCNEL